MKKQLNILSLFLYILGFLLLLEWVWPIEQFSDTTDIWIFQVFLIASLLLSLIRVPMPIGIFLKGVIILFFLHLLYFEGSFLQTDWVRPFFNELGLNIQYVFSINWIGFTPSFRSLLFFILLWSMAYLLNYWVRTRKQIFVFFFMTILFITVLDTFTPYDASNAVVRTIVIGFVMMGIMTIQRVSDKEEIQMENSIYRKWILSLSGMVVLSVILGFALPKHTPIWPDPIPYIQVQMEESASGALGSKVGYGIDDSRLGGPIARDNTVVFRTEVESSHYWKVEAKDVYTGKGWVHSDDETRISFAQDSNVPITSFVEGNTIKKTVGTSKVYQVKEYDHVLYPLGVKRIQAGIDYSYEIDPSIEKIYSYEGSKSVALDSYSVTFEKPKYSVTALKSTANVTDSDLSNEFISQYTQLPDSLPQRIKDLASEITADEHTWYDKAVAIEQYFKGSQFSYDTENVMVPGGGVDYVDQFLFDSMRGYCDNFSTSMVVLLRSLDIPARWVKGYTEGEFRGYKEDDSTIRVFDVTNNNAHSWVEVYFPQVGWVSFEPTPGFSNDVSYNFDEGAEVSTPSVQMEEPETPEQNRVSQDSQSSIDNKQPFSFVKWWMGVKEFYSIKSEWILLVLLVLCGVGYYIYRIRVKWLPWYYIRKFKRLNEDESFENAYVVLLKQLERIGFKRKEDQTLREYAKFIDDYFSTIQMTELTSQYEQYVYGNQIKKGTWKSARELWENLIKQTIA